MLSEYVQSSVELQSLSLKIELQDRSPCNDMPYYLPKSWSYPLKILISSGPFYYHLFTLTPAWINDPMPSKMWGEITNTYQNLAALLKFGIEWINSSVYKGCN